ncbi:hypothetical protein Tco_0991387 [Tanacetum coccineum]|uniref:Uncharacterized protein n=1 Tax=Tanacetum coccineum TaxID=301880 RepID=A0ABQ5EZX1_9ASTR
MHVIHKNYNNRGGNHASKNNKNDDTPMRECHEVNYIQSEGYQNQNSHDSCSHQSYHDPNDYEKSLTELNNDVKHDIEYFKSYEWEKSQNVSSEQTDRTEPPPPSPAHTKQVNVVFTKSGKGAGCVDLTGIVTSRSGGVACGFWGCVAVSVVGAGGGASCLALVGLGDVGCIREAFFVRVIPSVEVVRRECRLDARF